MDHRTDPDQSDDDRLFDYFFDEAHPTLCNLPNLVLRNGGSTVSLVLNTVGQRGGAWGMEPPFARDGGPYLGEREKNGYFRTWGIEANQRWLRERGGIVCLGSFTMLIDVGAAEAFLEWIYHRSEKDYGFLLDDMLPLIVEWIEDIRWAYFPLTDEYPIAMFLTRPSDSHWVDDLEAATTRGGGACCRVFLEGERCAWRLPDELKRLCKR